MTNYDDIGAPGDLREPEAPTIRTLTNWTGDPEPRRWLVPGWLPAGRVALLAGPGGSGKSLLALQLRRRSLPATGDRWGPLIRLSPGEAEEGVTAPPPIRLSLPTASPAPPCSPRGRTNRRKSCGGSAARERLGERLHVADLAGSGPLWTEHGGGQHGPALRRQPRGGNRSSRLVRSSLGFLTPSERRKREERKQGRFRRSQPRRFNRVLPRPSPPPPRTGPWSPPLRRVG